MRDQDGMRAVGAAVAGLMDDSFLAEGFHRGRYHRLRVGPYRVLYVVDGDTITIERVDASPVISRPLPGRLAPGRMLSQGPQFPHKSAAGRRPTESPQTIRNYAVLDGTVAMMAIGLADQRQCG